MNEIVKKDDAQVTSMPWMPSAPETPMEMVSRAVANGAGIDVLEKLLALQERWEANQGRKAFDQAIAAAKGEIPEITKNRTVEFTSSKGRTHYQHEDMAEIARVVNPILSKHGLSYRYRTAQDGRVLTVTCILSHRDGYSEETTLSSAADDSGNKNHIQAIGSAATYLQRYTLKMALGLAASADDDGRASGAGPTINAEQFQTLRDKLEASGSDEARFLKFFGCDDLHTFPAAKFADAVRALDQRAKANAKRGDANA